jgi:hypothetical protein
MLQMETFEPKPKWGSEGRWFKSSRPDQKKQVKRASWQNADLLFSIAEGPLCNLCVTVFTRPVNNAPQVCFAVGAYALSTESSISQKNGSVCQLV